MTRRLRFSVGRPRFSRKTASDGTGEIIHFSLVANFETLVLHPLFGHFTILLGNFVQLFLHEFFLLFLGFGLIILIFEFFLLVLPFLALLRGHLEAALLSSGHSTCSRASW